MNMKALVVGGLLLAAFLVGGDSILGPTNNDDYRATAAVSIAGAIVSPDGVGPNPSPSPTPGPKPPRKDCVECKGTGKIVNGDGNVTDCTYCEPPGTPDELFELQKQFEPKAKKCCPHCDCKDCGCTYPGQCLVEANGGEPVRICDDRGCAQYVSPDYKMQPPPPLPVPVPVVDPLKVVKLEELRATAVRAYRNKDYVMVMKYIQGMDNVLATMEQSPTTDTFYKECNKARRNVQHRVYLLDKEAYDKFLSEYATHRASLSKFAEQSNSCSSGSCGISQSFEDGGCSSGSCDSSGGDSSQFRFGSGGSSCSSGSCN